MAGLSFELDGNILYDEALMHVHDSLAHIEFFRDLIKRTGLLERAEEVGWVWGSAFYGGCGGMWEIETEQFNRLLAILDLPAKDAWINDASHIVEEIAVVEDPETGEAMEVTEEDLVVTLGGDSQEDLDRLLGIVRGLKAPAPFSMTLCRYIEKEDAGGRTLAAQFIKEDGEEENPTAAILIPNMGGEPWALFHTLFPLFIRAWEVMRDGEVRG